MTLISEFSMIPPQDWKSWVSLDFYTLFLPLLLLLLSCWCIWYIHSVLVRAYIIITPHLAPNIFCCNDFRVLTSKCEVWPKMAHIVNESEMD